MTFYILKLKTMLEIQKHKYLKNTKIVFDPLKETVHQISNIFREK